MASRRILLTLKLCALAAVVAASVLWPQPAPVEAAGVASVSAGSVHTCALTTQGGVKCWGDNFYGQLADGTTTDRDSPVDVIGLSSGVAMVAAGSVHTCALSTPGGVKCWGQGALGALGDGTGMNQSTPVDVVGLPTGVAAIAAGSQHTCALTTVGGVKCWGDNTQGALGDGQSCGTFVCATPVDVVGLETGVTAIAVGGSHSCALTTAGGLKCWGNNFTGQVGDGQGCGNRCTTPVDVSGFISGVAKVAAGATHTCAITTAGNLKCWGSNVSGELGAVTTESCFSGRPCSTVPIDVCAEATCIANLTGVAAVAGGAEHTCALTTAGGVKCWGHNEFGELGDGTTTQRSTPVDIVALGSNIAGVSTGGNHSCALTAAGGVECWGRNTSGQLGDGQACGIGPCTTPVDVVGFSPKPVGGLVVELDQSGLPLDTTASPGLRTSVMVAAAAITAAVLAFGGAAWYARRRP